MRKAFVFKLYPNRGPTAALAAMLEGHRLLYNAAVEQRRIAWRQNRVSVSYGQQSAELKALRREIPALAPTSFSSCQATLRRLDKSFAAFFRRGARGYPRFKSRSRFDTVEFPALGDGCAFDPAAGRVYVQHVGRLKVKLHRPTEGRIKTLSLKRAQGGWYVILSCDLGAAPSYGPAEPSVGLDLGLTAFVTRSDGVAVAPPRFLRESAAALRRAQRRVARRKKGSARRRKAVAALARLHQHVANQRRDWHHKLARALVSEYGLIAVEALNIHGIARSRLAKSTLDAAWGQFLGILHSKAAEAGVQVVAVPARNTSQACSQCGALPAVPKTLADRVHRCSCGCVLDRDHNAALNILRLGRSLQSVTSATAGVG
ncbi:MAG TPA: transposase [Chloroflexota bacterium]|nr:transposase [Chloroflexota bacterium]